MATDMHSTQVAHSFGRVENRVSSSLLWESIQGDLSADKVLEPLMDIGILMAYRIVTISLSLFLLCL